MLITCAVLVGIAILLPELLMGLAPELDRVLTTTAAALTLPLVLLFILRARSDDRRSNLALAAGFLLLGAVVSGVAEVGLHIARSSDPVLFEFLRTWGLVAAFGLFTVGLYDQAAPRNAWIMAIPGLTIAGVVVATVVTGRATAEGIIEFGWASLVVANGVAYLQSKHVLRAWMAVGFFGYLLGEITDGFGGAGGWVLAAGVERVLAGLIIMLGLYTVAERSGRDQLAASRLEVRELLEVSTAAQRALEERDHEARGALAAMEYAVQALRRRDQLSQAAVTQLEVLISTEIALLRRLITLPDPAAQPAPFLLLESCAGVIEAERSLGLDIYVDIAPDVAVVGSADAMSELLQGLLENARRHAPGSPVRLTAESRRHWAIVTVDDDGPGIPVDRRNLVFRRGRDAGHPTSAGGRGLGLFIADRLAREQGGHIWVEDSASGGASFRVALPIPEPGGLRTDEREVSGADPVDDVGAPRRVQQG